MLSKSIDTTPCIKRAKNKCKVHIPLWFVGLRMIMNRGEEKAVLLYKILLMPSLLTVGFTTNT